MERKNYSEITPKIMELAEFCSKNDRITPDLFLKYQVNRGLRDVSGKGVLTGLTDISDIRSTCLENGVEVPCEGRLSYRGINIEDIVNGFLADGRFGFEEVT